MPDTEADLPLMSFLAGQALVLTVVGAGSCAVASFLVDRPWISLVATAVGGGVGLGLVWLMQRRLSVKPFEGLQVVEGPIARPGRSALTSGAVWALGAAVISVIALVALSQLMNERGLVLVSGPVLLGFGGLSALSRHDVQRVQNRDGVVLCIRLGARRFAWTRAQARARLVAVRVGGE